MEGVGGCSVCFGRCALMRGKGGSWAGGRRAGTSREVSSGARIPGSEWWRGLVLCGYTRLRERGKPVVGVAQRLIRGIWQYPTAPARSKPISTGIDYQSKPECPRWRLTTQSDFPTANPLALTPTASSLLHPTDHQPCRVTCVVLLTSNSNGTASPSVSPCLGVSSGSCFLVLRSTKTSRRALD